VVGRDPPRDRRRSGHRDGRRVHGVAGGEFLIPTIVLLFGVDIRIAGSPSLVVSLPTMLAPFACYGRDSNFGVLPPTCVLC
jgi:hypothetical protein